MCARNLRAFVPFMIEHAPETMLGVLATPSPPYEAKKRAKGESGRKMLVVRVFSKTRTLDFADFGEKWKFSAISQFPPNR